MSRIENVVVTKVYEKTTKKDGTPLRSSLWSICVGDKDWHSYGFTHPGVTEGDLVSFEAETGKFGSEVKGSITVATGGAKATPAGKAAVTSYDNKQSSIVYQSCLKVSGALVSALVAADILPLPSAKNKKVEAVIAMTEEIATGLARKALSPDLSEVEKEDDE